MPKIVRPCNRRILAESKSPNDNGVHLHWIDRDTLQESGLTEQTIKANNIHTEGSYLVCICLARLRTSSCCSEGVTRPTSVGKHDRRPTARHAIAHRSRHGNSARSARSSWAFAASPGEWRKLRGPRTCNRVRRVPFDHR